jgi:hypothetical protein
MARPRKPRHSVPEKRCSRCLATKLAADFGIDRQAPNGLKSHCKECLRASGRAYHVAHLEARRIYKHGLWIDPDSRQRMISLTARWRAERRQEIRCRAILGRAVLAGIVARPSGCSRCGVCRPDIKIHGHHNDYANPLAVVWLCSWCHAKRHRKPAARAGSKNLTSQTEISY